VIAPCATPRDAPRHPPAVGPLVGWSVGRSAARSAGLPGGLWVRRGLRVGASRTDPPMTVRRSVGCCGCRGPRAGVQRQVRVTSVHVGVPLTAWPTARRRVPTRGQSTDGPTVLGWTQHGDGMEHAWSPGASRQDDAPAARRGRRHPAAPRAVVKPSTSVRMRRNPSFCGPSQEVFDTVVVGLARRAVDGTRLTHSLPLGVERPANRLLPPGARLADGPGCPPDRGRPMSTPSAPIHAPGRGDPAPDRGRPMSAPGAAPGSR
jgi:hypothetical protein